MQGANLITEPGAWQGSTVGRVPTELSRPIHKFSRRTRRHRTLEQRQAHGRTCGAALRFWKKTRGGLAASCVGELLGRSRSKKWGARGRAWGCGNGHKGCGRSKRGCAQGLGTGLGVRREVRASACHANSNKNPTRTVRYISLSVAGQSVNISRTRQDC